MKAEVSRWNKKIELKLESAPGTTIGVDRAKSSDYTVVQYVKSPLASAATYAMMYPPEYIAEHAKQFEDACKEQALIAHGLSRDDIVDSVGFTTDRLLFGLAYSNCSPSRNAITGIPVEDDSVFAPRPVEVELVNENVA